MVVINNNPINTGPSPITGTGNALPNSNYNTASNPLLQGPNMGALPTPVGGVNLAPNPVGYVANPFTGGASHIPVYGQGQTQLPQVPAVGPAAGPTVTTPGSNSTVTTTSPSNTNAGIVSSTDARNTYTTESNNLDKITNTVDPYYEYLLKQQQAAMQPSEPGVDEKNASVEAGRQKTALEDKYEKYKAGLQVLGIENGIPENLLADQMINADKDNAGAIQDIQSKEDLAIAKAKQARIDTNSKALKDANDEIRQYKKDKADELQSQLDKRTQDITVANSLASYALSDIAGLPQELQQDHLHQIAQANNIDVNTLIAAMTNEKQNRYKFSIEHAGSASGGKPLSTAALNFINKQNPLLKLPYGTTQEEADMYIQNATNVQGGLIQAEGNKDLLGPQGYFTYDYINNALDNLPAGVDRMAFLNAVKDKLALGSKGHKGYNITEEEYKTLTGTIG